jgi:hypothetical protein
MLDNQTRKTRLRTTHCESNGYLMRDRELRILRREGRLLYLGSHVSKNGCWLHVYRAENEILESDKLLAPKLYVLKNEIPSDRKEAFYSAIRERCSNR